MSPAEALALLSPAPIFSAAPIASVHRADAPAPPTPTRWADLGSGSGLFTFALASLLQPGSIVYAVDRQPGTGPQSTPHTVTIQPIKTDFVKHPPAIHDLDGILMANSLHYVKDKPALIRSLRTTHLRPQHALLIIEYDTDRSTPIWVPYPVSFQSLVTLFHAAGYPTVTRLADQPSIYNRNKIYSAYITV